MLHPYLSNLDKQLGGSIFDAPVVTFAFKSRNTDRRAENRTKLVKYNLYCVCFVVSCSFAGSVNTLSISLYNRPVERGHLALSAVSQTGH